MFKYGLCISQVIRDHVATPIFFIFRFWFFDSSHFMVGVCLKAANNKHLAVSVDNFRTAYDVFIPSLDPGDRYCYA
jgi:hypothetical protein